MNSNPERNGGNAMNTMRRIVLGVAALMLVSCSQPPVPQDHFYRLQITGPETALQTPRLAGTLEVANLQADGLISGRPIVFTEKGRAFELSEYHYHFWTEPPADMLGDALVTYLRGAGVAREVTTPELRLEPDYVMTGKIRRLEQVRGNPTKVAAALEVALRDRKEDRLMLVRNYEVEKEVSGGGVAEAVVGLNAAVSEIYGRLVADISGL